MSRASAALATSAARSAAVSEDSDPSVPTMKWRGSLPVPSHRRFPRLHRGGAGALVSVAGVYWLQRDQRLGVAVRVLLDGRHVNPDRGERREQQQRSGELDRLAGSEPRMNSKITPKLTV